MASTPSEVPDHHEYVVFVGTTPRDPVDPRNST